ncbi:DUF2971 domain-containing protein [Catenovulum sediminis]|uniref:DUF2971 domain-containing protein n=1 Tax=Catenovulum sediminis TaxID=1740262 RepID=UPI00117CB822|nr:DUF2971 domain-containing protein [Catenovulum sediminis]
MILYKYSPLNEGAKKILTENTLKYTAPDQFNDPFDCLAYYDRDELENYFRQNYHSIGKSKNLAPAKRIEQKHQRIHNALKNYDQGNFEKIFQDSKTGITCFTRCPKNILMWSHYADYHKGFVVGFECIPLEYTKTYTRQDVPPYDDWQQDLVCFQVKYSDDRPVRTLNKSTNSGKQVDFKSLSVFFTKARQWEYEQEYRCISYKKGAGIFRYKRELIREVIIGVKTKQDEIESIKGILSSIIEKTGSGIKLYQAYIKQGTYELGIRELQY